MASRWNPNWKENILKKSSTVSALNAATIRVYLVDKDDYSDVDFDGDTYLSDAPTGAFAQGGTQVDSRNCAYFSFGPPTVTLGVFSSPTTGGTFQAPTATPGDQKETLLFVDWKTSPTDSPLVLYLEEITVTPNNADITIGWYNGGDIAKL